MLEMYRRDRFRQDLLVEQCLEVVAIEDRLREIDSLLEASLAARRSGLGDRCECGAPIVLGSHFCANCGRPVSDEPVVACSNCGAALPAEARFCASCGAAAPEDEDAQAEAARPARAGDGDRSGDSGDSRDR